MKRIIRLTESDLARIVKRVISEQPAKTPMVDGASSEAGGKALIVLSKPTISLGAPYRGTPSIKVTFNGIEADREGNVIRKGNIVAYGICGYVKDAQGGGGNSYAPSNLSLEGVNDVPAGNLFVFKNNGPVGAAARAFCTSKGAKDLGPGVSYDAAANARAIYKMVK